MSKNTLFELTRILHDVGLASNPEQQVRVIVDSISDVIGVDVCSLYRKNHKQGLELLASHGLHADHPLVIPMGQGLVGRVMNSCSIVNLIDPDKQLDYYYVPFSDEEHYKSFCGVPLMHHGDAIGVLVVQRRRAKLLSRDQEALLLTLSAHLALIVKGLPESLDNKPPSNVRTEGVSGAPGLAIGRVALCQQSTLSTCPETPCEDPQSELQLWLKVKAAVSVELESERRKVEDTLGEAMAGVLDAYQMFLSDPSFESRVEEEITKGKSLPWAVKQTVSYFSDQFLLMSDPYLRARHEDIEHLGDKIFQTWSDDKANVGYLELGDTNQTPLVLVGTRISVSDIVNLPAAQLKAIVCSGGAALSHIAIFANALGIPAVMGIEDLPIQEGELVLVDGDHAQVITYPEGPLLQEYQKLIDEREIFGRSLMANIQLPAITLDGEKVALLANSGLQADIMPSLRNGADGVGLYRTEIPFMIRQSLPSEDDQTQVYRQLLDAFSEKPVYFRTLDVGGDKPLPYLPSIEEDNPALGLRGIRFTLDNTVLLLTQLRAIIRAAEGRSNVSLLLPMIASTQELDACLSLLTLACAELQAEGYNVQRPKIGIMVEVPAVISMLPFWVKKIDFISIGSNDLSQYLLAVDRNNPLVAKYYDALHPAVLMELQRIVDAAKYYNLPLSFCGEMASDPIALILLLGMGVRQFSMSSSKIPYSKSLIRSLHLEDAKKLLIRTSTMDSADKIRKEGRLFLDNIDHALE